MEVILGQTPIDLNELKQNLFSTQIPADGVLSPGQSLVYRICKPAFPVAPRSGYQGQYYYGQNYDFPYELEILLSVKRGASELVRGKDYNLEESRTDKYAEVTVTPLLKVEQKTDLTIQPVVQVILNGYSVSRTFSPETVTLLPTVPETYFDSFLAESTSTEILRSGEYLQASLSTILQSLPEGASVDSFPIKTTMPVNGKPTLVTIHSVRWEAFRKPPAGAAAAAPVKLLEGQDFKAPDGLGKITSRFLFLPKEEDYEAYAKASVLTECNGITQTLSLTTPSTVIQSAQSAVSDIVGGFDLVPDSFHALQPGQALELKLVHSVLDLAEPVGNLVLGALNIPWKVTGIEWKLSKKSTTLAAAEDMPLTLGKDYFLSDTGSPFGQKLFIQPSLADTEDKAVPETFELKGTVSYLFNGVPAVSNPVTLLIKQLPIVKEKILSLFQVKSSKSGSVRIGEKVLVKLLTPLESLADAAHPLAAASLPDLQWFPIKGGLPIGGISLPFEIRDIAWSVVDGDGNPLAEGVDFQTTEGLNSLQTSFSFLPPKKWDGAASSLTRKVQASVAAFLNGLKLPLPPLELPFSNLSLLPFQDKIVSGILQHLQVTRNADVLEPGTPLAAELTSSLAQAGAPAGLARSAEGIALPEKLLHGKLPFIDDLLPFELPIPFQIKLEWKLYKQVNGVFELLEESEFHLSAAGGNTSENVWKDSRLDVLLMPQVKGFHQLAEIELRYLEAHLEIQIPTLPPIKTSLPKLPITQIPIAVPELLLATEHRLDDLDQAGDRLIVLPQSSITGLTRWDLLKPVLEKVNGQIEAIYGLLDGVTGKLNFVLMLLGLKKALGHVLQPIGGNKLWVVEALGDEITDLGDLPKTDHGGIDDDEWDDEISGFVAILPNNRKITFYETAGFKGDTMEIRPDLAREGGTPFGNIVCILNNLNVDTDLDPYPAGTLSGRVKNDDVDAIRFSNAD